ncbi:hypothetical protein ADUPG1_007949, partial [Aduncisulcus paluster]
YAFNDDAAICGCDDDTQLDIVVSPYISRSLFNHSYGDIGDVSPIFGFSDDACSIHVGTGASVSLNGMGCLSSVFLSSSSSLAIQGTRFIVGMSPVGHNNLLSSSELEFLTTLPGMDVRWVDSIGSGSDQTLVQKRACIVSMPSSYSTELVASSFGCAEGFSDVIIDNSIPSRGGDVSNIMSFLTEFSSSTCGNSTMSNSDLLENCTIDVPAFPVYDNSIQSIQVQQGVIYFLDEDEETVASLVVVNSEASSYYYVYLDDAIDEDDSNYSSASFSEKSEHCNCCNQRVLIQSDVETLSFHVFVQISLYRDGVITIDYSLDEADDISGKINAVLSADGHDDVHFDMVNGDSLIEYSGLEGCESWLTYNDSEPQVQFSSSIIPITGGTTSFSIGAPQCDTPCAFGQCVSATDQSDDNSTNQCECSILFTGSQCSSCKAGWGMDSSGELSSTQISFLNGNSVVGIDETSVAIPEDDGVCSAPTCSLLNECNSSISYGTCSGNTITGEQECLCVSGYAGEDCGTITPAIGCSSCLNGGICFAGECFCPEGYYGDDCSYIECPDGCSEGLGGGECDTSTGQCECNLLWSGDDCSEFTSEGECMNGTAIDSGCVCQSGWSGDYCQCKNNCSLHGLCMQFGCDCDDGFEGDACEIVRIPTVENVSVDLVLSRIVIVMSSEFAVKGVTSNEFDGSVIIDEQFIGYCNGGEETGETRIFDSATRISIDSDNLTLYIYPGRLSWIRQDHWFTFKTDVFVDIETRSVSSDVADLTVVLDSSMFPYVDFIDIPLLSWIRQDHWFTFKTDVFVDIETRSVSSDVADLTVVLDSSMFPYVDFIDIPLFLPNTMFIRTVETAEGTVYRSPSIEITEEMMHSFGWGRLVKEWEVILSSEVAVAGLDVVEFIESIESLTSHAISSDPTTCGAPYVANTTFVGDLIADTLVEYGVSSFEIVSKYKSLFELSSSWTERSFPISVTIDSGSILISSHTSIPEFPQDSSLSFTPSVQIFTGDGKGEESVLTSVVWECLNAKEAYSFSSGSLTLFAEANTLLAGDYACVLNLRAGSIQNGANFEFSVVKPVLSVSVPYIAMAAFASYRVSVSCDTDYPVGWLVNRHIDGSAAFSIAPSISSYDYTDDYYALSFYIPSETTDNAVFDCVAVAYDPDSPTDGIVYDSMTLAIIGTSNPVYPSVVDASFPCFVYLTGNTKLLVGENAIISAILADTYAHPEDFDFEWIPQYDVSEVEFSARITMPIFESVATLTIHRSYFMTIYDSIGLSSFEFVLVVYYMSDSVAVVELPFTITLESKFVTSNTEPTLNFSSLIVDTGEYGTKDNPAQCGLLDASLTDGSDRECVNIRSICNEYLCKVVCDDDGFDGSSFSMDISSGVSLDRHDSIPSHVENFFVASRIMGIFGSRSLTLAETEMIMDPYIFIPCDSGTSFAQSYFDFDSSPYLRFQLVDFTGDGAISTAVSSFDNAYFTAPVSAPFPLRSSAIDSI